MNSEKPLVSIIFRTRDRPFLVKRILQSIAAQTYRQIEVLFIDNGGYRTEAEECQRLLGNLSFRYIALDQNSCRAHAGNIGIANARGSYLHFLNDEYELYPEHISILCDVLKNTNFDVAYSSCETICLSRDQQTEAVTETGKGTVQPQDFSPQVLLFENYIPLSSVLFASSILHSCGGFDESLDTYEDWDLLIRVSAAAAFCHIAVSTVKHLQWMQHYSSSTEDAEGTKESYMRFFQKHSGKRTPEAAYAYYRYREKVSNAQNRLINILREELQRQRSHAGIAGPQDMPQRYGDPWALKSNALSDLKKQLEEKTQYLEELHNSLGWKAITFYREKIKCLLVPEGTRREKVYRLAISSLPLFKEKGFLYIFKKAKNVLRRMKAAKHITREEYHVPSLVNPVPRMIDTSVSVVIPTRNAGNEFRYTLEKIVNQQGIQEIEVIIIDSGSEDDTIALAKKYGARVYSVSPYEFNHGATRNEGAEKASGEFLIFMSQDAVPISNFCISDMIGRMLQDEKIAAATVTQIPRSDTDLFSCWQLWFYNNKLLRYSEDTIVSADRDMVRSLSPAEKRRLTQIDDVFSCFRRQIFNRYKFNHLPYAEDLDLGMRLIEGEYRILFMTSAGVIHSHTRDTEYFFKRGYIDTKTLLQLLQYSPLDWKDTGIFSMEHLLLRLHALYRKVDYSVKNLSPDEISRYSHQQLLSAVQNSMRNAQGRHVDFGEPGIDRIFSRILVRRDNLYADQPGMKDEVLMNQYLIFLDSFFEYLMQSNISIADEKMLREFYAALYKLYAWTSGSLIGNYSVFAGSIGHAQKNIYIESILGNQA